MKFKHPRQIFATKDKKYLKKQILCTFVAFFLAQVLKTCKYILCYIYSLCFMETWFVSEQGITIIKVIKADVIRALDKHVLEKSLTSLCVLYHLSFIQDSHWKVWDMCWKYNWVNNTERNKRCMVKSSHFEFSTVSYATLFLFEMAKFVL